MFSSRKLLSVLFLFVADIARAQLPFDSNGDGFVDLHDYAPFAACLAGSGPGQPSGLDCLSSQGDADTDVDLADSAMFLNAYTGPIPPPSNDNCAAAIPIGDGSLTYASFGATTDGADHFQCNFFGRTQIDADIWYLYTASCTGTAVVSLCGSDYDTKLAVYANDQCPTPNLLACSDDACGTAVEQVQSRVEVVVGSGVSYLVRVGGFDGAQGTGRLTISCGVDACAQAENDCFKPAPSQEPGCNDEGCCTQTCSLDQFCCDVTWDSACAAEAQGVCLTDFLACAKGAGGCGVADGTPGCDDLSCCNTVCLSDPFCCLTEWDATCVNEAEAMCFLTCGAGAGACDDRHVSPGCNDPACCALVCADDVFCCSTEWDQVCVDQAAQVCP